MNHVCYVQVMIAVIVVVVVFVVVALVSLASDYKTRSLTV